MIIIVSKLDLTVDQDKTYFTNQEGQHRLTRVNVLMKVIIIIVLKPDSGVDTRQGSGHKSGG
jgi:hypothetical protein